MNFCDAHTVPKKVGYLLGHNRTMIVMNTRNLLQKLLMVPVLLVVFSSSAYGFYDASVGRWINRDPIQEQGGKNLYRFASNRPLQKIDRYGLAPMSGGIGGPQFIPPGGFPRPPKKCPDENCNPCTITDRARDAERRNQNLAIDPDPYQGGYRHCVAACLLGRCFGSLGNAATYLRDSIDEDDGENSTADILGEQRGMDHAENSNKSCEDACLESYPPMQGPAGPPPARPAP